MTRWNLHIASLCASAVLLSALPAETSAQTAFTIAEGQTCLDAGCHATIGTERVVHKPASKATTCKFCHKATEPQQHDFKLAAKKTELCSKCHKMVSDERSQHMPAKRGMCTNCHDPHQSENRHLVKKKPVAELCRGCHRKIGKEGEIKHGPVEGGLCTACHNPHASNEPKLMKDKLATVCNSCHRRSLKTPEGDTLPPTRQAYDDESLNKHVPFKIGKCTMCHLPHSGDNFRLLKGPYPEEFYANFAEQDYMCFNCHKSAAFEEPRTTTATDFRNGDLNLHYRHVNREKGRSCRACHQHHAAEFPKLIRAQVPFGQRSIDITEFTLTENGGTCAPACHIPLTYDRVDPVNIGLKMTPRPGEMSAESEGEND